MLLRCIATSQSYDFIRSAVYALICGHLCLSTQEVCPTQAMYRERMDENCFALSRLGAENAVLLTIYEFALRRVVSSDGQSQIMI